MNGKGKGFTLKESKQYRLNEIVFRQGDESAFMYRVLRGKVGLFLDYGSSDEVKLAELLENQIFGEMGLLDHVPRSATAVVLEEETELETFTEEDASGFFVADADVFQTAQYHAAVCRCLSYGSRRAGCGNLWVSEKRRAAGKNREIRGG